MNSFAVVSASQTSTVEVVALVVLGVDDHLGERVAGRVGTRAEQLRMVVATGVGAVIGRLPGVAHEDAHRLRLRRGRPEEQQAQDEDGGGGAAQKGAQSARGPRGGCGCAERWDQLGSGSARRRLGSRSSSGCGSRTQAESSSLGNRLDARLGSARLGSARLGSARLGSARLGSARLRIAESKRSLDVKSFCESFIIFLPRRRSDRVTALAAAHITKNMEMYMDMDEVSRSHHPNDRPGSSCFSQYVQSLNWLVSESKLNVLCTDNKRFSVCFLL